jgi:hypothetical protein
MIPSQPIQNLKVSHPCPYLLSRMKKDGDNFFCEGCNKTIFDFRDKSLDEIQCIANKNICGIFTSNQLPGQQKMKFSKQIIFYGLTILSYFGFSVRPLIAQSYNDRSAIKDTVSVDLKITETKIENQGNNAKLETESQKRKKNIFRRNKKISKQYRVLGCADF